MDDVSAVTGVTGFGLLGHLWEICDASNLSADIRFNEIPVFRNLDFYLTNKCFPGGTERNWQSYGHIIGAISEEQRMVLCDPQTSGGLLFSVDKDASEKIRILFKKENLVDFYKPIGELKVIKDDPTRIKIK